MAHATWRRLNAKTAFDPQQSLGRFGTGKAVPKFKKDEVVFAQGEAADTVITSSPAG